MDDETLFASLDLLFGNLPYRQPNGQVYLRGEAWQANGAQRYMIEDQIRELTGQPIKEDEDRAVEYMIARELVTQL